MKIMTVLSLLLLIAVIVNAQTESKQRGVRMSTGGDAVDGNLRLTTTILSESYCADGRIRYLLSFKFTNLAGKKIILGKFRPVVTRYMISRSPKDASARKYEADARILIDLDESSTSFDSVLDESKFVFLDVGTSYAIEQEFSVLHQDEKGNPLQPGTHVLQVVVPTWYYPSASNIEWRDKWRDKGYLWSDSVVSDLMPFVIANKPTVSQCR